MNSALLTVVGSARVGGAWAGMGECRRVRMAVFCDAFVDDGDHAGGSGRFGAVGIDLEEADSDGPDGWGS